MDVTSTIRETLFRPTSEPHRQPRVVPGTLKKRSTGLHRYVWLTYEQQTEIHPPMVVDFAARRNWNLTQWLEDFGLREPVAGNFFVVAVADEKQRNLGKERC